MSASKKKKELGRGVEAASTARSASRVSSIRFGVSTLAGMSPRRVLGQGETPPLPVFSSAGRPRRSGSVRSRIRVAHLRLRDALVLIAFGGVQLLHHMPLGMANSTYHRSASPGHALKIEGPQESRLHFSSSVLRSLI